MTNARITHAEDRDAAALAVCTPFEHSPFEHSPVGHSDSIRNSGFGFRASSRRGGFTLVEMLVVVSIIVIIILMAIPAIRAISGTRSVDAAQNTLSALITRAREEAVGIQDYRGVLFYLDPTDDRMKGMIVMATAPTGTVGPAVWLDAEPGHDYLPMPNGIGVQTINNIGAAGSASAYIGYTPMPSGPYSYGGVILFDGYGRLVSTTYGLKLVTSAGTATNLAIAMQVTSLADYVPTTNDFSQFGLVLYDREQFSSNATGAPDTWLDANSTPILINRYTGTLIRAE